ncbi:MAG: ASPIC/UnbV domain-containing protein, partial [Arenicellales bacterium]|nr:ASPIC/UnbV domain-containing protein [Arenicellales bacterium]
MNLGFRNAINSALLNNQGEGFLDSEFILGVEPRRDGRTAAPWFELDCDGADREHKFCQGRSGVVEVWGALGSRSSVIFDFDNDGDLDIITNDFNSEPLVLESDLTKQKSIRFLKVRLIGSNSNRDGLGAKVILQAGDRQLIRFHDGKSGYLSQSSMPLYFGLDNQEVIDKIEIDWPSGKKQTVAGPIKTNQTLTIKEDD